MRGVAVYYWAISIATVALATMMMFNWSRAPRGIRAMATKLGKLRIPVGLLLVAAAAFLVFGQDL
ncbi:MAG TPA: hypothetical protein VGM39_00020 [Kofleriaceae bacterium]|jgi:hypothetical protein